MVPKSLKQVNYKKFRMTGVKVIFSPYELKQNKYVEIIQSLIQANDYNIHSLSELFTHIKTLKETKIIHLNWFENISGNNQIQLFYDFIKKNLVLIFLKLFGKKIIWTMHNKVQHDLKSTKYQKILQLVLIKISNRIIIHSKASKTLLMNNYIGLKNLDEKIRYIPHPDYIDCYGKRIPSTITPNNCVSLLFMGMIREYKNIELLIDVIKCFDSDEVNLQISGNYISTDYLNKIIKRSEGTKNITFNIGFIPDSSIPEILSNIDLLILPYEKESSLNSGTVILAFSYKRSVICPKIGTISDLANFDNILTYEYDNEKEHFHELYRKIKQAIDMKKENKNIFEHMGENIHQELLKTNSKEDVRILLQSLYSEILNKNNQ